MKEEENFNNNSENCGVEKGMSLGIGATANCNLNCGHCYSRPLRGESLTLDQLIQIVDGKKVSSVNFGTGENFLNKEFPEMIDYCHEKGIKLSLTSNGYSIIMLSDEQLLKFNDLDVSLDFMDKEEQNRFRKGNSWNFVDEAIKKCQRLDIEFSITTALMNINYQEIPRLLERAGKEDCNLRLNIFKPVPKAGIYEYQLNYEQFWDSMKLLFSYGELISCSEPIVNAMLNIPPIVPQSPCGLESLRIHPNGEVMPCVYWDRSDVHIDDLKESFQPAFESDVFQEVRKIPSYCLDNCEKVDICGGGCASRRHLNSGLDTPDAYCPIYLGKEIPKIEVTMSQDEKDLVHSSYLCTLIFKAKPDIKERLKDYKTKD